MQNKLINTWEVSGNEGWLASQPVKSYALSQWDWVSVWGVASNLADTTPHHKFNSSRIHLFIYIIHCTSVGCITSLLHVNHVTANSGLHLTCLNTVVFHIPHYVSNIYRDGWCWFNVNMSCCRNNLSLIISMATFSEDWKYRGEGNSSLVVANTEVSMFWWCFLYFRNPYWT